MHTTCLPAKKNSRADSRKRNASNFSKQKPETLEHGPKIGDWRLAGQTHLP